MQRARRLAVIGAGWAGLSAAVRLVEAGNQVTVFEASQQVGGRARRLLLQLPNGQDTVLDNGQHILIGAYSETLALLAQMGVERARAFLESPLRLVFPDGQGLRLPNWPRPWDALAAIGQARGWTWQDKAGLLTHLIRWRLRGFAITKDTSVAELCAGLSERLLAQLIEPLCVSVLNTPTAQASARVFLRVLQDSVLGPTGSSHLLLPKVDLGELLPRHGWQWLQNQGAQVLTGQRVTALARTQTRWLVNDQPFDGVVLATSLSHAIGLLQTTLPALAPDHQASLSRWLDCGQAIGHAAIATVYVWSPATRLSEPMLALHSDPQQAPAQFVFDRGQLGAEQGVLAFVVSASQGSREQVQAQVLRQAQNQLGLIAQPIATVIEKRATFACTPGLARPWPALLPGLVACGDYLQSPYPATLETAVRSGAIAARLCQSQSPP